jgi:hypothetical protein
MLNATLLNLSRRLVGGCNSDISPSPDPAADSKVSIILTAFGDKDGTSGETPPYLQALTNQMICKPASPRNLLPNGPGLKPCATKWKRFVRCS